MVLIIVFLATLLRSDPFLAAADARTNYSRYGGDLLAIATARILALTLTLSNMSSYSSYS